MKESLSEEIKKKLLGHRHRLNSLLSKLASTKINKNILYKIITTTNKELKNTTARQYE
jgi:hypothetical protein